MISPGPLLIVMGTIVSLLAVQRLLMRIDEPEINSVPSTPAPPKPRGRPLYAGLSVTGLDERGVTHLKALIDESEITPITSFLAGNRPGVIELDNYLAENRKQLLESLPDDAGKPTAQILRKALKSFEPTTPPAGVRLDALSNEERLQLFTFDPQKQRFITRELMAQFGGQQFIECFDYYCSHEKSITIHVPPLVEGRTILETLAKTGVADKGRQIPLPLRLTVLKMNQLRQMANDLNSDIKFTRKKDATEALAKVPGAAVLLSMQYIVDDLFVLKSIDVAQEDVLNEWTYFTAYAKLLASKRKPSKAPASH